MICFPICDHQLMIFFLQVKARLGQAWQAINKVPASEGVSFSFQMFLSDLNISLWSELFI